MVKLRITIFFFILASCAPKPNDGTIWLTEEQLNNTNSPSEPMPVLNARCPYNDSTGAQPVKVKGYKKKRGIWVHSYKRSLPTQKV